MSSGNKYQTLKDLLEHPGFIEGNHWRRGTFKENALVIVEGEIDTELFVVLKGTLMVCTDVKISADRTMQSGLCELFDGEEFSHASFFDSEPHSATVKALSACELAIVDAAKLKSFLAAHPDIGYHILYHWLELMIPRFRQGNKRIATLFSWGLKAHQIDSELDN